MASKRVSLNEIMTIAAEQALQFSYYAGAITVTCTDTGLTLDTYPLRTEPKTDLQLLADRYYHAIRTDNQPQKQNGQLLF